MKAGGRRLRYKIRIDKNKIREEYEIGDIRRYIGDLYEI